jgi:uncharacterized protein (DUF1800 family)
LGQSANSATPSRRAFLQTSIASVGAASAASALSPEQLWGQQRRAQYSQLIERIGQRAEWRDIDLRLVRRTTLGMTSGDVARVKAIGFSGYLEEQLAAERLDDAQTDARLARYPEYQYSRAEFLRLEQTDNFWPVTPMLQRAIIERAAFSRRQLKERMIEFWTDHFYINFTPARIIDYREVVIPHALGNFHDMVRASMRSTAMLQYLDQVWSTKYGVNENYARELLELHTCSPSIGYTQQDVHDFARILTGWTVDNGWNFQYRADLHDFGAKRVLGMTFPARAEAGGLAGIEEATRVVDFLLEHPNTARFIATKLLKWFVRPDPSAAQISAVASVYSSTKGDIKSMLRAVLTPNNLANAPAKLKRPYHLLLSAIRSTGVRLDPYTRNLGWEATAGTLSGMGHGIFGWQTPDGYPDSPEYWSGMMVDRWNAMHAILGWERDAGRYPTFDPSIWESATPSVLVEQIATRMFAGEMSTLLREQLLACVTEQRVSDRARAGVFYALCSPEFQFY